MASDLSRLSDEELVKDYVLASIDSAKSGEPAEFLDAVQLRAELLERLRKGRALEVCAGVILPKDLRSAGSTCARRWTTCGRTDDRP